MVRISKRVWESFEFNLNRAKALAQAQHYLQLLAEQGEEVVQTHVNELLNRIFGAIGIDFKALTRDITEAVAERVKGEFEQQLKTIGPRGIEQRLGGSEEGEVPDWLEPLFQPLLALQLLAQQTLIESAVVLAVASYEAFLRDVIAAEARRKPSTLDRFPDVQRKLKYETYRRYGGRARLAQAELLAKSLDAYQTDRVRSYFKRIYGIQNVFRTNRLENDLSRLIQIRHLIVHRGGVVDRDFKRATKSKQRLGERIELPYRSVLRYVERVREFGRIVRDS